MYSFQLKHDRISYQMYPWTARPSRRTGEAFQWTLAERVSLFWKFFGILKQQLLSLKTLRLLSQVGFFISPRIKHQTCRFSRTLSWKLFVENLKLIYFTSKEDLNLNTCDIPTNWSMNTQTWSRGWYWFNSHVHYHHKTIVFKESRRCLNMKYNCKNVWHIASCEWSWVICCPLSASFAPKIFSIWKLGHLGRYLATGQLSW